MSDRSQLLCRRAQEGDTEAASELVELHYRRIYGYLRRLAGTDEDAADLTQKTFFKAWVSIATYEGRSSFSTWLHQIAYYRYVDWRRRTKPATPQTDEWWEACKSETAGPLQTTVERDLAGRLFGLVERLEEEVRDVVHLHYYQGLSIEETSAALGIATSTVKYRMRGAIQFLRERIETPLATSLSGKNPQ